MTETRIRWSDDRGFGCVGTIGPFMFQIVRVYLGPKWMLTADGMGRAFKEREPRSDDMDELKAVAEGWVEEFVTSLGATFPADDSAVTRFEVLDHTIDSRQQVSYSPGIVRSVVARGVKIELSRQDDGRTLKVFLTSPDDLTAEPRPKVSAARLREAREYFGLSQQDAASRMERDPGWVDDIEHGRTTVTGEELRRLSRLYRRPVEWLRGETTFRPDSEMLRQLNENPRLTEGDREAVLDFAEFLQGAGPAPKLRRDRG